MTRLFEVEITIRSVVAAADDALAYGAARFNAREMMRDNDLDDIDIVAEIKSLDDLPAGWDGLCLPYGGDGTARINAILEEQPLRDTKTADMFEVPA